MTKLDRGILKNLVVSREFEVLKRLSEEMVAMWTGQISTGNNEFEYLRSSFERDGKILGLRALIKEIESHYD